MMNNISVIYFLSGLNETNNHPFVLFSLTLLYYCLILLVNIFLVVTIILDKNLHEPMYVLLCTFCMNGLYGSTGFYPKFLWNLLSPVHVISYSGCLIQALIMYSFAIGDLSILAVMAYDRYLAICRPLEYHAIMSKEKLFKLVCFSWITPFCFMALNISLTSRLELCSSYIRRPICSNWSVVKLACFPAETLINSIVAYITISIYLFHGFYIVWSYLNLIKTCVNSKENRAKFMQTCVPHITSLVTFLLTVLFDVMHMRFGSEDLPQNLQNFIAIEFVIIPPIMNPLIYGFKLTKIRNRILCIINIKIK